MANYTNSCMIAYYAFTLKDVINLWNADNRNESKVRVKSFKKVICNGCVLKMVSEIDLVRFYG